MEQDSRKNFYNKLLREARLNAGLLQRELADRLGTTTNNVSRWERGQTVPGPYFRTQLCVLFGKSVEELGFVVGHEPRPDDPEIETSGSPKIVSSARLPSSSDLWAVPYSRNPFFTGREDLLHQLHELLDRKHVMALTGLGGVGKTQLALEYAHRYRQKYRYVFWVSVVTHETLQADFATIAEQLQLSEKDERVQDRLIQAVKQWLATHEEWLLILDNADDIAMVQNFMPGECPGHVLLTSRAQALGTVAQRIDVEDMGVSEGTLFFLRRAKFLTLDASLEHALEEQLAVAEAIVMEMAFLPLALDQAGAYIDETGCSLSAYLKLYREHRQELLQRRGQLSKAYSASVATTWSLSFQRVEQANPTATNLLRLCAFLEPDTLPEELFIAESAAFDSAAPRLAKDTLTLNMALEELRKFSLIQRIAEAQLLRVHRLVQTVLKDAMAEEDRRQWAKRAVQVTASNFPEEVEMSTWLRCRRFLSQAQTCTTLIYEYGFDSLEAASLLQRTAKYLQDHALYERAEPLYQRALAIREQVLQPGHPDIAMVFFHLGALSRIQGRYAEASERFQQTLQYQQAETADNGPVGQMMLVRTLTALGNLSIDQGKYYEAEGLFQRAVDRQEHWSETSSPQFAASLNGLGNAYLQQGKYTEAELAYQRALLIWERSLEPEHPETAHALSNLATLYYEQGRYEEAKPLSSKAVSVREQALGPTHPLVAYSLVVLGSLFFAQGNYKEAQALYQRALQIWERALGPTHSQVAYSLAWLGKAYRAQGSYKKAEQCLLRAIGIREQALGSEHAQMAALFATLGGIYREQGNIENAWRYLQHARRICEQTLRSEHPDTIYPLTEIGALYRAQGTVKEAIDILQRAIELCEQILSPEHPKFAALFNHLADCYQDQREYTRAEAFYARALHLCERTQGSEHPELIGPLSGLANIYREQGKPALAESLYERALHLCEHSMEPDHPQKAEILQNFAVLRASQSKTQMAISLCQRALAIQENVFGPQHPKTIETRMYVAQLLQINTETM